MKSSLQFLSLALALFALTGNTFVTTRSLSIEGRVKNSVTITIDELEKMTLRDIGSVNIINHKGEKKSEARNLKGVLLREILENVTIDAENPKVLSEYYFICVAEDQYKVVYSWNELFNTNVGNGVFIVLTRDGKQLADDEDGLLMISRGDEKTGRRYVKNLQTIQVKRAE